MDERKKLLQTKLAADKQRLVRQDYLAELPERLGTYLESCSYLQSPELDTVLPMFFVYPDGVAPRILDSEEYSYFKPEGYVYREFSWPDQLLRAALSFGDQHDAQDAFFYPFDGPLYQVPFGWVCSNLLALFACKSCGSCPERLGVVSRDLKVGLILDNYAGCLEEDLNPGETVYQLATWGFE